MSIRTIHISMAVVAAALAALTSCSSEPTRFAVTDMTWAEFYAGELGVPAQQLEAGGYDAVTSATTNRPKMFSSSVVSQDGTTITGVKDVAVAMTESVFRKLSDEQKARFTFVTDSTFAAYKVLDSKGNFGKYNSGVKSAENAEARVSSGSSANWGNYIISLSNVTLEGAYHGVVLTDEDGAKYGLKTLDNIWLRSTELAVNVAEFTTKGVNKPGYRHTQALQGKRLKNITYIMSGADAVSVDVDILLKKLSPSTPSVSSVEGNTVTISGLPEGYTLTALSLGSGRNAQPIEGSAYSFEGDIITLLGDPTSGTYRAAFESPEYVDLAVSFEK